MNNIYQLSTATKTIIRSVDEKLIFNTSPDKFLLRRQPSKQEIAGYIEEFHSELLETFRWVLRMPRGEYRLLCPRGVLGEANPNTPTGLAHAVYLSDKTENRTIRYSKLRSQNVLKAAKELGYFEKYALRKNDAKSSILLYLSPEEQLQLLDKTCLSDLKQFAESFIDRSGSTKGHTHTEHWTAPQLLQDLQQASSAEEFLEQLAGINCNFLVRKLFIAQNGRRPLAKYWFAKFLHRKGVWLFPDINNSSGSGVPTFMGGAIHRLLLDYTAHDLWYAYKKYIEELVPGRDQSSYFGTFFLLDQSSNFLEYPDQPCSDFFHQVKLHRQSDDRNHHFAMMIRKLWRFLHDHHGLPIPDDLSSARLTGAVKERGNEAFAWVDVPEAKSRNFENYVGKPRPIHSPPYLIKWAQQLRELLPHFGVTTPTSMSASLNYWLLYLCTIPNPPADLSEIHRRDHINSQFPDHQTYYNFLMQLPITASTKDKALTALKKAWLLHADLNDSDRRNCPIDTKIDRFKDKKPRRAKTVRRVLSQEILEFIIEQNRKDNFDFSKNRVTPTENKKYDYRKVYHPNKNKREEIWWPGMAVIMDLLLNIPLRNFQARYLDSGEGDEYLLNIETLEYTANHLNTATHNRQEGFFIRKEVNLFGDPALGIYINTNKTGQAYEVPWMNKTVARNIQELIDWQKHYNPITRPVRCKDREHMDKIYVDEAIWPESYPIFRDPDNPYGKPMSQNSVLDYLKQLLKHCEVEFEKQFGKKIHFFRPDGKCIFDIHSLRATGVTLLILKGVDPEIVKVLVGHSSIEMTLYYRALEDEEVFEALCKSFEERSLNTEDLINATPEELEKITSNLFTLGDQQDAPGISMLQDVLENRDPRWEIFTHGICPGGNCSQGGGYYKNAYHAVYRERACSLCRFRLTGPAFLVGMVQNANRIMWEIKEALTKAAEFNKKADLAEDNRKAPDKFRSLADCEKRKADNLWEEWFAEVRYIQKSETLLENWLEEKTATQPATITPLKAADISHHIASQHDLIFLHNLVRNSRIMPEIDLPRGPEEDRNRMLLKIARNNNIDHFLLKLDPDSAEQSLDLFADTLIRQISSYEEIEDLLTGNSLLKNMPHIHEKILSLITKTIPEQRKA